MNKQSGFLSNGRKGVRDEESRNILKTVTFCKKIGIWRACRSVECLANGSNRTGQCKRSDGKIPWEVKSNREVPVIDGMTVEEALQ